MRTMRLFAAAALAASIGALALVSSTVAAPKAAATTVAVPVQTTDATGTFDGTFQITKFVVRARHVVAVGTLTGTVTNALTGASNAITQTIALPLNGANAPTASSGAASTDGVSSGASAGSRSLASTQRLAAICPVLHLVLGPLDLNLLGVVVHLNQVVLDVTAVSGAGNLLGNLLCSVTGLLNGGVLPPALVAQLLNLLLGL